MGDRQPWRVAQVVGNLETGGMQMVVLELVRRLDRSRFEPVVITLRRRNHYEAQLRAAGVRWFCVPVRRSCGYGQLFALARALRRERIDLVHTHSDLANAAGRMAGALARVPFQVAHYHNTYEHRLGREFRLLEHHLLARTALVMACSRGVEEFLRRQMKLPAGMVRSVPNGRDFSPFVAARALRDAERAKRGIADGEFHILHSARLEPHKAPERLLEALALLPEDFGPWRASFVGDGSLRPRLMERAAALAPTFRASGGRVDFTGWSQDIPQWLASSDLYVLASQNEGLSLSLLEAMAAGVPVISSDILGPREVLGGGGMGGTLVDTADAPRLAREIVRMRRDGPWRAGLVAAGQQRLGEYDPDRFARTVEGVYADLLSRTRPAADQPAVQWLQDMLFLARFKMLAGCVRRTEGRMEDGPPREDGRGAALASSDHVQQTGPGSA
jgi:glycosyltransferase involved in cell wall biosynthesis